MEYPSHPVTRVPLSYTSDTAELVVAVGDPQTSLAQFLRVLRHHALLVPDADGEVLGPNVHLVTLGDYFDFGGADQRQHAAEEGLRILHWLAAHPREQVTLIAGNHDLARVGELMGVSDARFSDAVRDALESYPGPASAADEAHFLQRYPEFPSTEAVARDFSAFRAAQRDLVLDLLLKKRLRLAAALHGLLFSHAGVTRSDLAVAGAARSNLTAEVAAQALNDVLDEELARWDGTSPFTIRGLHTPGSAATGEGGGILYHRATHPSVDCAVRGGPGRRRYDPRQLPLGLVQVIGHVRDAKSRALLGEWVSEPPAEHEGQLRGLRTNGRAVEYRTGFPQLDHGEAGLVFVDGGMHHVPAEHYELLDVRGRRPFVVGVR